MPNFRNPNYVSELLKAEQTADIYEEKAEEIKQVDTPHKVDNNNRGAYFDYKDALREIAEEFNWTIQETSVYTNRAIMKFTRELYVHLADKMLKAKGNPIPIEILRRKFDKKTRSRTLNPRAAKALGRLINDSCI